MLTVSSISAQFRSDTATLNHLATKRKLQRLLIWPGMSFNWTVKVPVQTNEIRLSKSTVFITLTAVAHLGLIRAVNLLLKHDRLISIRQENANRHEVMPVL